MSKEEFNVGVWKALECWKLRGLNLGMGTQAITLRSLIFMHGLEVKFQTSIQCSTEVVYSGLGEWCTWNGFKIPALLCRAAHQKNTNVCFQFTPSACTGPGGGWSSSGKRLQKRTPFVVLSHRSYMEMVCRGFEFLLQELLKHIFWVGDYNSLELSKELSDLFYGAV